MNDMVVPSWRPSQEKSAVSGRTLAVAGGLLGLVALGAAAAWGVARMGPRPVPVIEADPRPLKIRPDSPGGLVVPNQDQLVLEGAKQRRAADRSRNTVAQLDAGPEAPALDLLRQQVARPASAIQTAAVTAAAPPGPPSSPTAFGTPSSLGGPTAPLPPPVALAITATVAAPVIGAAAETLPAPVAGGRSHAQFAALASEEAARAEWERLLRRVPELSAFQPRLVRLDREGQPTLWRLRATGLADAAAARALCDAVRARGLPCIPSGGGGGA